MALACVSCGALTRTAKAYGFSVLAIIGRWQDRRRPLAYYTAACGAFSLRTFASMDMSFITPQIVLVVLVTLVLLVAALVLVTLGLRSDGISASIRSTSDSSLPAGPQARYKGKTNAGPSAMANDTLINLLAWCKRERERLQMQREMLQSGRFRIFEKDDSDQQRDISNQHIEQIGANISELDRIIMADYEAKSV